MAWKYSTEDGIIEIVVDPTFRGDLARMASIRPVWIVDSPGNRVGIEAAWMAGEQLGCFEISQCRLPDPEARASNLSEILGALDDHQGQYKGIVVHGLAADGEIRTHLATEGFEIDGVCADGFFARMIPVVRGRLIGRDYS